MTTQMATPIQTIVYLTEADPFDQTQGASIKSLTTLKLLSQRFRVHVLFARRTPQPPKPISKKVLQNVSYESIYVPNIDTPIKKRIFWLIQNYLRLNPHHFAAYSSRRFSSRLTKCIDQFKPTYIWIDHVRMAQYWRQQLATPFILETHNLEWRLLYDCYRLAPKFGHWHFLIWLIEACLTKIKEARYFQQAKAVLAISPEDATEIKRLSPAARVLVFPPPLQLLKTSKETKVINQNALSLLFVGNLNWYPNADALKYFITQVWPCIPHQQLPVELHVVGQTSTIYNFTELIHQQPIQTIFLHHKQPNLEPFYQQADVVILPFQIAGGVRMKALEAIQHYKPIITTQAGTKGLPTSELTCQTPWLTANAPHEFAQAIGQMSSTQHRQTLIHQTKLYAQSYREWTESKQKQLIALIN